jgi:hypothetical protein
LLLDRRMDTRPERAFQAGVLSNAENTAELVRLLNCVQMKRLFPGSPFEAIGVINHTLRDPWTLEREFNPARA